jgi:hypothetical protein
LALTLERIEAIAAAQGKLLRIQAPRRLGLWNLRVAVARILEKSFGPVTSARRLAAGELA